MSKQEPQDMGQLFSEEEALLKAKADREIAQEKAAWDALAPDERAAIEAERERKAATLFSAIEAGLDGRLEGDEVDDDEDFDDEEDA